MVSCLENWEEVRGGVGSNLSVQTTFLSSCIFNFVLKFLLDLFLFLLLLYCNFYLSPPCRTELSFPYSHRGTKCLMLLLEGKGKVMMATGKYENGRSASINSTDFLHEALNLHKTIFVLSGR